MEYFIYAALIILCGWFFYYKGRNDGAIEFKMVAEHAIITNVMDAQREALFAASIQKNDDPLSFLRINGRWVKVTKDIVEESNVESFRSHMRNLISLSEGNDENLKRLGPESDLDKIS